MAKYHKISAKNELNFVKICGITIIAGYRADITKYNNTNIGDSKNENYKKENIVCRYGGLACGAGFCGVQLVGVGA